MARKRAPDPFRAWLASQVHVAGSQRKLANRLAAAGSPLTLRAINLWMKGGGVSLEKADAVIRCAALDGVTLTGRDLMRRSEP